MKFVKSALEIVRFNLEPRFELLDHRGKKFPKPDEFECLLYFNKAKRVVELSSDNSLIPLNTTSIITSHPHHLNIATSIADSHC